MTILSILNELAEEPSINAKVKILAREKNNELLKRVFKAAYDTTITYGIKQIPEYCFTTPTNADWPLEVALDELHKFATRELTGNAANEHLKFIFQRLNDKDNCEVFKRIIQRDLRCNVSSTLASRVWPNIVPVFDVMLAHKDISGIKYPCLGQIKYDGSHCHLIWNGKEAKAFSRNGKEIQTLGVFDSIMLHLFNNESATIAGELLVVKDGKILDRKTGNGIINKANKGTITESEANCLRMVTWDIVDTSGTRRYDDRLYELKERFFKLPKNMTMIMVAETRIINSQDEAQQMFEDCISAGHEGAMMKNMDQTWQPKRVKGIGKMKAEAAADLRVVDVIEGTGKYKGMLGALVCETQDGLLRVNVGSGFTDEERITFWYDYTKGPLRGKIVEVLYNQKITSKGKDKASLFLPRFLVFREDKNVANNIDDLK